MRKKAVSLVLLLVLSSLLAACGGRTAQMLDSLEPIAWLDAPLDNSTVPLAPYQVVMHGSHLGQITEFELSLDGVVVANLKAEQVASTLFRGEQGWSPPEPGTYTLEVRAKNPGGNWSEPDRAVITVRGEYDERVSTYSEQEDQTPPTRTPNPTPSPTPTVHPSHTPSDPCTEEIIIKSNQNVFCRLGSNPVFDAVGILQDGQEAVVVALNPSHTWAYLDNPSYPGENFCWVWMNKIQFIQGDPACALIKMDPPTPTPTSTPLPPTPLFTP